MRLLFLLLISLAMMACSNTQVKSEATGNDSISTKQVELISDSLLESKLAQLTNRAILDSSVTFRFDTLTYFSWDTLIIIPTYWNIERLENELQLKLTAAKKAGLYREDISILAFIKKGQLIKCVQLPRTKGDFSTLKSIVFSPNNCTFQFIRTKNKFLATGQPVVEGRIAQ